MELQELLWAFAKAAGGFAVVLGLFIAVQYFIRQQGGCHSAGKDLLDYMPHGCANCSRSANGQCSRGGRKPKTDLKQIHGEEEHQHELA